MRTLWRSIIYSLTSSASASADRAPGSALSLSSASIRFADTRRWRWDFMLIEFGLELLLHFVCAVNASCFTHENR